MLSRFEALADQVGRLLDVDDAILDGEVIAADESGRPQFYELLRVPRSASYAAFDILWATAPTSALCRSASAESGCKRFCRPSHRSSPRRYPSRAGGANSSS